MTREEAIMVLKNEQPHCGKKALFPEEKKYEAFNMAIEALEQEPCEDAISREDLEECKELMTDVNGDTVYAVRMSNIRQLSSVNPQKNIVNNGIMNITL